LFFLLAGVSTLPAQFSIGLKSSLYLSFNKSSEIKLDDELDFLTYKIRFLEEDVSPSFGLFAIAENNRVYLRMDLAFRQIKSNFNYVDYMDINKLDAVSVTKETKSFISPIQMGLRLGHLRLGAGPVISYSFSQTRGLDVIPDLEERNRSIQGGYHIALAFEVNHLLIDIQYESRFHGAAEGLYYRGDNKGFNQSSQYLNLGLSYLFNLSR